MWICCTVSIFNVWYIDEIVKGLEEHGIFVGLNYVYAPEHYDLRHLPRPVKQQILDKLTALPEERFVTTSVVAAADGEWIARTGRQDLYFQYRHNSPNNRRIDPAPNNIIDLYLLTKTYSDDYYNWVNDVTGKIAKPTAPTSEELRINFLELENYKMISDTIIYNTANFRPLFGSKAESALQALFKVVKNPLTNISDTEIKSKLLSALNNYFSVDNWDFGETFYFTELATYIQQSMAPYVSSIIIVPNSTNQVYGSLQQITSLPNEILISAATVDNIEIISSITAAQLNLQNSVVNTIIT